jgi:putative CocE/NonD family hydrolase
VTPLQRVRRKFLGLPPRQFPVAATTQWVAMPGGERLATTVMRATPVAAAEIPVVLVRTATAVRLRGTTLQRDCRLLAEGGYTVVLQECRGRGESEGEFAPFEHEADDAAATLDWIADQEWGGARVGVFGFGYAGFAAWAALGAAPDRIHAAVIGFQPRSPYACFRAGGALRLDATLRFALGATAPEAADEEEIDFARGTAHRPVIAADRVALRRSQVWNDILQHPELDDFWQARTPQLPDDVPPTLLLAGWYDAALRAQLCDFESLREHARKAATAAPRLVVGPWSAGLDVERHSGFGAKALLLRTVSDHFDQHLRGRQRRLPRVRTFWLGSECWREYSDWPPANVETLDFHLRADHAGVSRLDDGALSREPADHDEPAKSFRFDPEDPVPSVGGVYAASPGPADQRSVEARADVLCYTTAPLSRGLEIAGEIRVELFVASTAPDTDFTAKLVRVNAAGEATILCDGIVRARDRTHTGEPNWFVSGEPQRVEIDLGALTCSVASGECLRLEVSSSNFPVYDRNANCRTRPEIAAATEFEVAEQTVYHDASHPSRISLQVLAVRSEHTARNAKGPPA